MCVGFLRGLKIVEARFHSLLINSSVYSVAIECFMDQGSKRFLEWPNMGARVSYQGQGHLTKWGFKENVPETQEAEYMRRKKMMGLQCVHREPLRLLHPLVQVYLPGVPAQLKFTFPNSGVSHQLSIWVLKWRLSILNGILTHKGMNISTCFIKTLRMVMVLRRGGARLSQRLHFKNLGPKSV